jgi:hypothetical protein
MFSYIWATSLLKKGGWGEREPRWRITMQVWNQISGRLGASWVAGRI